MQVELLELVFELVARALSGPSSATLGTCVTSLAIVVKAILAAASKQQVLVLMHLARVRLLTAGVLRALTTITII